MELSNALDVKKRAKDLGAEVCGIAAVDDFSDVPAGFHPRDILPEGKSVIVFACRFPVSSLAGLSKSEYAFLRKRLVDKIDSISFKLALDMELAGYTAIPVPTDDPYEHKKRKQVHAGGILSLKHAAVHAGLGKIGKNTLLVNKKLGNLLWLGAVITDKTLSSDPISDKDFCLPECRSCLDACPVEALDGVDIDNSKCLSLSSAASGKNGEAETCYLCQQVCPNRNGFC